MSAAVNYAGIPQFPVRTALTTSAADIFTPTGAGLYIVTGIRIANIDNTNTSRCRLYWTDTGPTDRLFFNDIIAADDSILIEDPMLVHELGLATKLRGDAQADNDLVVTVYSALIGDRKP